MPKDGSMGISEETDVKQEQFNGFIDMHTRIVQGIFRRKPWMRKPYIYLDLYAGKGTYQSVVTGGTRLGSPLVFLSQVAKVGIDFEASFFDNGMNGQNIAELSAHIQDSYPGLYHRCRFHDGDNLLESRSYLGNVPPHHSALRYNQHVNANRMGLIYADPNGDNIDRTFEMLSLYSRCATYRTVDILVNVPATIIKRVRNANTKYDKYFSDYINMIDKSFVIVREPHTIQQWMFVFLTNWANFPQWEKKGWYRIDSDDGKRIMAHANYTAEEKRNGICPAFNPQPTLFDV